MANTTSYLDMLHQAYIRSCDVFEEQYQSEFAIDTSLQYEPTPIIEAIVTDFEDGVANTAEELIGRCFMMVRDASYILNELGIRHCPTIGNVTRPGGSPRYTTTLETLLADVRNGYIPHEPANAHAWLTLDSGQVLDLTILASFAQQDNALNGMSVADAIYLSRSTDPLTHIPMLMGFGYHFHVVTHPYMDMDAHHYIQWINDYYCNFQYQPINAKM